MSTRKSVSRILLVAAVLLAGCATGRGARPETPQRVPDSAPDKIAAQRSAAGLHLEEDDQRWGFEAGRELKRQQQEQKKQNAQKSVTPLPAPPNAGPGPAARQ
jgi:hypothetical protein